MSSEFRRQIDAEHIPDAAWIIALWKAIHGGDPSPEDVATRAIASLAAYVTPESSGQLSVEELRQGLKLLGVTVEIGDQKSGARAGGGGKEEMAVIGGGNDNNRLTLPYCFHWAGKTICIPRPKLTHLVQQ